MAAYVFNFLLKGDKNSKIDILVAFVSQVEDDDSRPYFSLESVYFHSL